MKRRFAAWLVLGVALSLGSGAAQGALIDLGSILTNPGYEDDLVHSDWIATLPNANYLLAAPVVNQSITPLGDVTPLTAPVGNNFIGVLNDGDNDINGKLVHESIQYTAVAGDVFFVTIYANRGREAGATTPDFASEAQASDLNITFDAWGAGSTPVVNPNTDDWNRNELVHIVSSYSDWTTNGDWSSQTFFFEIAQNIEYLSLSIAGLNHVHDSYVAWDLDPAAGVVPEPTTFLLFAGGLAALGMRRRRKS